MRDLVPFALNLRDLAGSYGGANAWVRLFAKEGASAIAAIGVHGDRAVTLHAQARRLGLIDTANRPIDVRMAQLVLALDVLDAIPETPVIRPEPEPLVFTVPPRAKHLVEPIMRLDVLVCDVIAQASRTLHIGGPFWNEGGWERLRTVVLPALEVRGVQATFYLHPTSRPQDRAVIGAVLDEAAQHGSVRVLWWAGGHPSLMHAKFAVADEGRGYFGSANMTSLGLGLHLEMGVALQPEQSRSLLTLLEALEQAGLFRLQQHLL